MNEKIENLLNISLNVSDTEREKSPSLSTGYNDVLKMWEIIVRYTGDIDDILTKYTMQNNSITVKKLINNYAIIHTPQHFVELIASEPYIEFVEKPKQMYFQLSYSKSQSCINTVTNLNSLYGLRGERVIVAVIDTGIDITSMQFRNKDGSTRILNILDQTLNEEWSQDDINNYLGTINTVNKNSSSPIGVDVVGHGTDVAVIACGSDGVAPLADIIIVKMALSSPNSFPRTTQLMEALDYVINKAQAYQKPVAINISFGNNYGDHTGSGILEQFINDIAGSWKCSICIGTGNEGLGATHTSGYVKNNMENIVELAVGEYESSLNMQIWKAYWDDFDVQIIAPNGVNLGIINRYNVVNRVNVLNTTLLTFYGEPKPFSTRQEIYIDMIPQNIGGYIQSGIWTLRFIPKKIVDGRYDIWLPSISELNNSTGFLIPDSELTFTIPSTATKAISVGAYNARTLSIASFSGRGYVSNIGADIVAKPELIAPGVSIGLTTTRSVTGTSFATPFVTGSCALLMEWGIVKKNDIYLYGDKLKAYLISGARKLPQYDNNTPNSSTGWGGLCLFNSFPQ